eukprot:CAMPEP_0202697616 /NCGR_PEP_ID=MMETSP1385-20130828/10942_1 /ASSEMBLY_ACC=CAM_ASM_000861 /TAXON_ID=933848 /ORGANISM="Elphidium margaritaceum" /LENGTH=871 /DNA_ID=CAMNT_0049354117 /DNA_START=31 /DNA_END=2646 /DNA_ORIENTATION=-
MRIESKPTKDELFYNPQSSIAITVGQFLVGIALYVLSYYLIDDAFSYWSTDTVTSTNVLKFIIGMLLLPFGLIFWQCGIFRLASYTYYHWVSNILFLVLMVIALFVVGGIIFDAWGISLWLEWSASFTGDMLIRFFQGVFLVLTVWLTAITLVSVLVRLVLQRQLYTQDAKMDSMQADASGAKAEQQPLISSGASTVQTSTDQGQRSRSSSALTPTRHERETESKYNRFREYSSVFLFFFMFLPFFMWLNCVMTSDWHRMYPTLIITKMMSETILSVDNWNLYFEFECGLYDEFGVYATETCYARLFFDVFFWYLFIFVVAMFAYFTSQSPSMRIALRRRVYLGIKIPYVVNAISVTFGEIIFWILWLIMMAVCGHYWIKIHMYDEATKPTLEVWARYIGVMSIQFMAMFLFCTTRIRLWNDCFMLSVEHVLAYHRFFGVLFLLGGYVHMVIWIVYLQQEGYEDCTPFASIPCAYHADNFTPIVMYYVMIFMVPLVYIIGTFELVRRRYFEFFYYLHLFGGLIMMSAILWHSSQAWRYIVPPLVLYTFDRMNRLVNSSRVCKVESLEIAVNGAQNEHDIEVVKLSFSVGTYSWKYGRAAFKNLHFKMGQYVFLHISNISLYEWHPFTISAGEYDDECSLMIQNEGAKIANMTSADDLSTQSMQFTTLLYLLAQKKAKNEIGNHEVEIHVDGPYGKPFVYAGYQRIVLVAGGIGVTPAHSIFSTLLAKSVQFDGRDEDGLVLPPVDLIWMAKDASMFSMFTRTWRQYEQHNPNCNNKFSVRLFATRRPSASRGDDDAKVDGEDFNNVVPDTNAIMYTYGRPDWSTVFSVIRDSDTDPAQTLVFVCGPQRLVDDVEGQAVRNGATFQSEAFLF